MRLNGIRAARGSRTAAKRLGRGGGSGLGKTAGRGHKGQRARAGGYHKVGFEGGQMPLQRRLPKSGFRSPTQGATASVRLAELNRVPGDQADLETLKAARLVPQAALRARVFLSGTLSRPISVRGLALTRGARAAIEAAGGRIEDNG
ncbi:MAG: 50S ribosomal protein L15 [Acidiferrobacteraceae bacterium]